MLAETETATIALSVLHKMYLALFTVPAQKLVLSQESLCPLTFIEAHFLCNCTHTWHGMNAGFTGRSVYFYASVRSLVSINASSTEHTG